MRGWTDIIQNAINYIEENITEDLNIEDIVVFS